MSTTITLTLDAEAFEQLVRAAHHPDPEHDRYCVCGVRLDIFAFPVHQDNKVRQALRGDLR